MTRRVATMLAALTLCLPGAAAGWSDDDDGSGAEPPGPEPVASASNDGGTSPEPISVSPAVPDGIYYVTETYVADVTTSTATGVTYTTETERYSPGTYARVLETVRTGVASSFDGAAFNGRASLTDGRAVAGTYYENYLRSDTGFVSVSIVFFQDDAELRRLARQISEPTAEPVVEPEQVQPVASAIPEPFDHEPQLPDVGPGAPSISVPTTPPAASTPVAAPTITPSDVAIAPVEVMRGRIVHLPVRASWPGGPLEVASWRITSRDFPGPGALAGTGGDPIVAAWDRLPRPGTTWPVDLVLVVRADGIEYSGVSARLEVAVRSPALLP